MRAVAATGHRPDKLGGYARLVEDALRNLALDVLQCERPDAAISGMALGWDTAFAEAAVTLAIPLIAAVPFAGQESRWPPASQVRYRNLIAQASRVVIVCEGGYAPWAMQKRNGWMVDNCGRLFALWDGTTGGTANCVAYARCVGRETLNLWPVWRRAA